MSKTLAPSSQTVTARDPKGLKFVSIVEAAYNKAGLSDDEAQRVNDTSGLADLIAQFIDGNRHENLFEDEEVRSNYKYPKEYKGPKPIATQVDIVAGLYTLSLGNTSEFLNKVLPTLALPQGAEGWFAIPSVDAVAKVHFPEVTDPSERYVRCVLLALEKLKASRPFYNYRDGQITVETLRRHARTAEALRLVTEKQTGDIIVIPAQLGMKHRGRSVRRARALFAGNEFGLGAWEVVNIALTHPDRLVTYEELDMDCAGDEFDPGDGDGFSYSPCVCFRGGGVRFDTEWFDFALGGFGAVSGFVPQE